MNFYCVKTSVTVYNTASIMISLSNIKTRYRYPLILLRQLVIADFKLRYQGSVLGYLWSLLRPLFMFATLYVVFVKFLPIGDDFPHYSVYLLTGIVLWNFFIEITTGNVTAIVSGGDLLRKINFPKYIIVLAGAMSALINLSFNLIVIGIFMYFNKVDIGPDIVLVPLLIFEIFIFGLGVAFFLSALFVRFRDVSYIWEVITQALFYATPILYPLQRIDERYPQFAKLLLLNPIGQAIQDIRHAMITPETLTIWNLTSHIWLALIPLGIVILTCAISFTYFKRRSPYFAEEV
jgi:ABC-2 type transport system permease protein